MSDFEREVREMLEAAMQQPGVAEALKIMEQQQPALTALSHAQDLMAPQWIHSVSTTTEPQR